MSKQKINLTIGRFQPFTKGHENMVNEGDAPCIIYQLSSADAEIQTTRNGIKIGSKSYKKDAVKNVVSFLNGEKIELDEKEKELLKRPFNTHLIEQEFDIIKKQNKNIIDVVYVKQWFDAIGHFNKFIYDNQDKYEPQYLMCGDDRKSEYQMLIDKYIAPGEDISIVARGSDMCKNVISNITINTGKGRTEGVSGTAVRASIIDKDKLAFAKIMPKGTDKMFNTFVDAFDDFKEKLESVIKESNNHYLVSLSDYITESIISKSLKDFIVSKLVIEGGQAGHMAHPIDYTEFTGNDLIELVNDLFSGKVEQMKEKLDGMNIMATMNEFGDVVFIRNNSNLNSEKGGMSVEDMIEKWSEKEHQKTVFSKAGEIITTIFKKLGKNYFNLPDNKRKVINCECIITGKTNIMPYAEDRVAFHGYKIYQKQGEKYIEIDDVEGDVDDIYKAAEGIDAAKPRPNLIIKSIEEGNQYARRFANEIKNLFKKEGLSLDSTIEEYKRKRFEDIKPEWLTSHVDEIFNRWFNKDKSFKATELKKLYPEHYDEVKSDKFAKDFIGQVMKPLDNLFLSIGNELIDLLDGFTNKNSHNETIEILKKDLESTVELVKKSDSQELKDKILIQLERLHNLNDKYNSAEGIVFTYKGKRMKLTGSFACINSILGSRFSL